MNKPSIFGAEESSDSDDGGDWVKKAMMTKKETKLKATTKNEMAAAQRLMQTCWRRMRSGLLSGRLILL